MAFVRVPDGAGFGEHAMVLGILPVLMPDGEAGGYVYASTVLTLRVLAGGSPGVPKEAGPALAAVERDTLLGMLDYGLVRIATGKMDYKHGGTSFAVLPHALAPLADLHSPSSSATAGPWSRPDQFHARRALAGVLACHA